MDMMKMDFDQLAFAILRRFLPQKEINDSQLKSVIDRAYSKFTTENRVEVVAPSSSPVSIAELFHGPTYCFKDLGLSMLCNLISHFTPPGVEKKRTLVVSTTGDTGPAALASVDRAANPNLNILAFFPSGGQISAFQRLQMTSLSGSPNIEVVEFCGGGDDMDKPIKVMQKDEDWMKEAGLCGVNR
jgi:threonine synthase